MKKTDRMPTTKLLLVISWIMPVLGLFGGGLLIIFNLNEIDMLIKGCLILFGGLVISAMVRMLANIGQMIFDMRNICEQANCDLKDINQGIHQIKVFFEPIERHLNLKK